MGDDGHDTVMGEALPEPTTALKPCSMDSTRSSSMAPPLNGNTGFSLLPSLMEATNGVGAGKSLTTSEDKMSTGSSSDSEEVLKVADPSICNMDEKHNNALPFADLPSGLCYDVRMRYHCEVEPIYDVHPEDPRRIYYIFDEICQAGLVDDPAATRPLVPKPLRRIPARPATVEEITRVHTRAHYNFVESTAQMTKDELKAHSSDEAKSIYYNKLSYLASTLSAGGAIETCRAVISRKVKNAIAVIRPPGHHAEVSDTGGFCLFNNVCIATRVCQAQFGMKCRKVMILDWDVHHGNGTQHYFYEDPNVLYISLHVFKNGTFYPGMPDGGMDFCGKGVGLGKNVNIPWPDHGMTDADYMFAFQNVVMPIAYEFDPDFVIISAGFDAAAGDELGGCFVTPPCYAHMTHMLMCLANGKLAVCLEGGYNLHAISKSALAVTRTLMGEPPDRLEQKAASKPAVLTVQAVIKQQSRYWKSLYPKAVETTADSLGAERMHDVIRSYQAKNLYNSHKMTSLYVYRDKISKSFDNQILATLDYYKKKPLLLIFHDPPEALGGPHSMTHKIEWHDIWLADVLKEYIDWAVKQDYAVIDVNIPKHLTGLDNDPSISPEDQEARRMEATHELTGYLWENYIECNDCSPIIFLGVGDAFSGMVHLLTHRDNVYTSVACVVSIVSNSPIRSMHSPTNYWLKNWYATNGLVIVAQDHSAWDSDPENGGKPKRLSKRYGKMVRSTKLGLNEMLAEHKEQIQKFIAGKVGTDSSSEED
ncbi:MAG: Histone deacetylase hda1 [Cirrosporium novae-zelandiae]|nr:MAG: Histone deacetylase hda1 [Cirrosporium novae-zelandiae]